MSSNVACAQVAANDESTVDSSHPEATPRQVVSTQKTVPNTSEFARAIQQGIWETIGCITPSESGDPTLQDFRNANKVSYKVSSHTYTFKSYCPRVFRRLRALFGVDPGEFLSSLNGDHPLYSQGSAGKSGATFFYSFDASYMVKSMTHRESTLMRRICPAYYSHVCRHPHTLICRYFGIFRIQSGTKKSYYCIMNNVLNTPRDLPINMVFDIKGSTYGRLTEVGRKVDHQPKKRSVLKELDLLRLRQRLSLSPLKRALLLLQLQIDSDFLASLGLIDYSLLLGINTKGNEIDCRVITEQMHHAIQAEQRPEPPAMRESDSESQVAENDPNDPWAQQPLQPSRPSPRRSTIHVRFSDNSQAPGAFPPFATMGMHVMEIEQPDVDDAAAQRARAVALSHEADVVEATGFTVDDLTNPSASLFLPSSWCLTYAGAPDQVRRGGLASVFQCEDGGMRSIDGDQIYVVGIIDILTAYTARKKVERRFKLMSQGEGISVAPPAVFAERFMHFARDKVLAPSEGEMSLPTATVALNREGATPARFRRASSANRNEMAQARTPQSAMKKAPRPEPAGTIEMPTVTPSIPRDVPRPPALDDTDLELEMHSAFGDQFEVNPDA